MEEKQTFGAYICRRRRELGLTQKEFAQRLFVTDSAVSKWERGLAYPDITLLQSICRILEISEKELLSAGEDTEGRRAERLAKKYIRLSKGFKRVQYVLYGLAALCCLLANLIALHTVSWFWIVLASEMTAASLTLLPALTPEGRKGLYSLCGFTGSLLLLLLVCCLYTGGRWFFIAAASVLFGLGIIFVPYVLHRLPLPESIAARRWALYAGTELALLLLLLGVCCLYAGGRWFPDAAIWSVFGLSVPLLPILLRTRQIPLPKPLSRHKALLYLMAESLLLLLGLAMDGWGRWFPVPGLAVALLCLLLPWLWLLVLRYAPVGGWFRAGLALWITGLWIWLTPWGVDHILDAFGQSPGSPLYTPALVFDFSWRTRADNVYILVLLGFGLLGLIFAIVGLVRCKRAQKD